MPPEAAPAPHFSAHPSIARTWNYLRGLEWAGWVWLSTLLALSFIVYQSASRDVDLRMAWHGWSPLDYVAHKLQPDNFHRDWPNGIKDMHHLWPMRIYYYLTKYFAISPLATTHPFLAMQSVFFVGAIAHMTFVLYSDRLASILAACLTMVSPLVGLNLARFGDGLGMPATHYAAPWGFALAFIALGLAQHFRGRTVWVFVHLALAMYCHAGFGLYALGFVGCWYLRRPSLCLTRNFLLGLGVFLVLMIPLIAPVFQAASANPGVSTERWITLTKLFSFHSFPAAMKMFGDRAYEEFVPWVIFSCLAFALLRTVTNPEHRAKLIWGYWGCLLATGAGILLSDFYPIVAVIKIQPHRASALITFLGGICLAGYLARLVRTSDGGALLLASLLWAYLLCSQPGLALIPLLLLLALDYSQGWELFREASRGVSVWAGLGLLTLLGAVLYATLDLFVLPALYPLETPDPWLAYILTTSKLTRDLLLGGGGFTQKATLWIMAGFLLLVGMLKVAYRLTRGDIAAKILSILVAAAILLLPALALQNRSATWSSAYGKTATAYIMVQLWARNNTPKESLFLTDPSHAYGWRDFSHRSSFGTAREWGFNALFYSSTPQRLAEGLRRLSFFADDITALSEHELADYSGVNYWSSVLAPKIRKRFCSLTDVELKEMSRLWGINYVVYDKDCHGNRHLPLPVAYENDGFVVYSLGS